MCLNLAFSQNHSPLEMLREFVFPYLHSASAYLGELSLTSASLSFRSADPSAEVRGAISLVGITFANVPFAEVAFATLVATLAVLCPLRAFVDLEVVCGVAVVGVIRVVIPGIVIRFVRLQAACDFEVVVLPTGVIA